MPHPKLRIEADVSFSSTLTDGSADLAGTVTADGSTISVSISGPVSGDKPPMTIVRQVARSLAQRQLRLILNGPQGMVVALGAVRAPWWQRALTRSPYIRLGNVRRARQYARPSSRVSRGPRIAASLPPSTLLPLLPTVSSPGQRHVTTTHDPQGGGMPRVIFALTPWPHAGDVQRVEYLTDQRTTFGSAPDCDVRIDGLEPLHAVIDRTEDDEYVLTHVASTGTSTVAGVPAHQSRLRTGAAIALGTTRLTYVRAEFADHGRPYGGRLGGEIGYQRPQARPRPRTRGSVGKHRTSRDAGQYFE